MQSDENLKNNLADQEYWDSGYAGYKLTENLQDDIITRWLGKHVKSTTQGTCIEIGCFPGRYLTFLGRKGYELNGVDITPRVATEFPAWLKSLGYKTGAFSHSDFFKFNPEKKFDIVCSFGFIEHFNNWEEVFVKHLSMVKEGGMLIIETPNFRGAVQRFIHYFLDYKNYKRHYVPAMNPAKWARICKKHGFKVIESGYLGEFQFWVDEPPVAGVRKWLFQKLIAHYPRLSKWPAGKKLYAPYCGIIAHLPQK